jgi:monothiol glutaredoxin
MYLTINQDIEKLINENEIMIFMKGSRVTPLCGFSNSVIQIFNTLGISYCTFDVLENQLMREGTKIYSDWPTIPQVYIQGEFIGGADIIIELYNTKQLQEIIETSLNS